MKCTGDSDARHAGAQCVTENHRPTGNERVAARIVQGLESGLALALRSLQDGYPENLLQGRRTFPRVKVLPSVMRVAGDEITGPCVFFNCSKLAPFAPLQPLLKPVQI